MFLRSGLLFESAGFDLQSRYNELATCSPVLLHEDGIGGQRQGAASGD